MSHAENQRKFREKLRANGILERKVIIPAEKAEELKEILAIWRAKYEERFQKIKRTTK